MRISFLYFSLFEAESTLYFQFAMATIENVKLKVVVAVADFERKKEVVSHSK